MVKAKAKAKKVKTEEDIFAELAKSTGGELASQKDPITYYVDTGNLALNYICSGKFVGGGIPGGRMTEIFGPSGSAKSLWGVTLLRGIQKIKGIAILLDCEYSLSPEFASRAGHVELNRLITYTPPSLEKVFSKIYNVTKHIRMTESDKGIPPAPILFVWDSLTVSGVDRQMRELDLPETYTKEKFKSIVGGREQPGERAALCSKEFRKLQAFLPEQNATLFIVNQTRTAIGGWGDDQVTGGGGQAMKFYPHCRLRTLGAKMFQDKNTARPLGVNIKIKNVKNRDNTPFLKTECIPLYFDRGIDPTGGLLTILVVAERVKPTTGNGYFEILEPWAGGKEITFRASLTKNTVPVETLYECPALVDANSKEEVEHYLHDFLEAIALTMSDECVEIDQKIQDNFFDEEA